MSQAYFRDQLRFILNSMTVHASEVVIRQDDERSFPVASEQAGEENALFEMVARVIYSEFYARGHPPQSRSRERKFAEEKTGEFESKLVEANGTEAGFEEGWLVESVEQDGIVCAMKGNERRIVYPGDYITAYPLQGVPGPNTMISLVRRREKLARDGEYYYAFGTLVGSNVSADGVRIYFDAIPNRAASLLGFLTRRLNELQVPFALKCFVKPWAYKERADNFVLYLDRMRVNYVFKVVPELYQGLKRLNALGDRTPLFALPLAPGVAFAESPPDSRDSFGMSRSRLIAKEVADLTLRDVPKGRWFDEIERSLVSANFDLRAFYRNPGSKSYYDLPFGIRQE